MGYTLPDVFSKCYQIFINILIRPLNLTSAAIMFRENFHPGCLHDGSTLARMRDRGWIGRSQVRRQRILCLPKTKQLDEGR